MNVTFPLVDDLHLFPIRGVREVSAGDDIADLLLAALEEMGRGLADGDILVIPQKVVSKAEGRLVDLSTITPSAFAEDWARQWAKDARQVEVVLHETARIVRMDRGVLVSETRHGFVCANAGVDASNVAGGDVLCLLPLDSDASAEQIRLEIRRRIGVAVGVIVSDTFGRAWREGQTNVAIGAAGLQVSIRYEGQVDAHGYELRVTEIATADEMAGAAEMLSGKLDGVAGVVVRGMGHLVVDEPGTGVAPLLRAPEKDMFR